MTLDEMQALCDGHDLTVDNSHLVFLRLSSGQYNQADADFVAMAVMKMPKLIAVARAGKFILSSIPTDKMGRFDAYNQPQFLNMQNALAELEKP